MREMFLGLLIAFILVVFVFVLIERLSMLHRYASTPDWVNPNLLHLMDGEETIEVIA